MAIPYGVSLEGFLDVIGAWNRARGCIGPLTNEEVASRTSSEAKLESKKKLVSNQNTFLNQIGILKKNGKKNQLTDIGCKISRAIDYDLMDEFVEKMSDQLWNWSEGKPLLDYLYYRKQVDENSFLERIVADAGKLMQTTNAAMGAQTLVDLFLRVGIFERDEDSVKMTDNARKEYERLNNL